MVKEAHAAGKVPVKVLAVCSGKGGVGKTNISVNLATGLAARGKEVVLMDADLGMANVDIMLGIRPQFDLSHVISGEKSLAEIIISGPEGIRIVPASSGIGAMASLSAQEHAGLIREFSELDDAIDYLVIDVAAGISDMVTSFTTACEEVIVVVCDEPASITDAYALIKVLNKEYGVKRFQVLCNRVKDNQHGRSLYANLSNVADQFLDVSLGFLGTINEDPRLQEAVKKQTPVISLYPHTAASVAFNSLVDNVLKLPARSDSGGMAFFLERVIQQRNTLELSSS